MAPLVEGYRLVAPLGHGRHGRVWRAHPVDRPQRQVAIKLPDAGDLDVAALRAEARALASLDHPHLVTLLDVVARDDGPPALVLPLAPGGSLADRIAAQGPLAAEMVADLGARLAGALAALHDQERLHRDVCLDNVLLGPDDRPWLADLGLARAADDDVAQGTVATLPPERLAGGPATARSDVYALAATCRHALTGQPPRRSLDDDADGPPPLRETDPRIPDALAGVLDRGMSVDPMDRQATAARLGAELEEAATALRAARLGATSEETSGTPAAPALADVPAPAPPWAALTASAGPTDAPARDGDAADVGPQPGTVRFGPDPRRHRVAPTDEARPRWPRIVAAAAVVALPIAAVMVSVALGGADGPGADGRNGASAGGATQATGDDPAGQPDLQPREAPPPCDDVPRAPDDAAGAVHRVDAHGLGCSVDVRVDGGRLVVPGPEGTQRYRLTLAEEDQLRFGDLDCDGREAPVLYRPSTGEAFVFEGLLADETMTVEGERTGVTDGRARVLVDEDGCARLDVEPAG